MQKVYLTGVVNDQTYSVFFFFVCFKKSNRSECDHLLHFPPNGRDGTVINRRRSTVMKTKTFDVLLAQR